MVNARLYPLWRALAASDDLPEEALPTVVEALCSRAQRTLPYAVDDREEGWRGNALKEALPALLGRVTDPGLRERLLRQATAQQVAELAAIGVVTAGDVPTVRNVHRIRPEFIAALAFHPQHVDAAIGLLEHLHETELERVVSPWRLVFHNYREQAPSSAPPVPEAVFDAVLRQALAPLAAALAHPDRHEGWLPRTSHLGTWQMQFSISVWRILEQRPERWPRLVRDPEAGRAVQHLLLEHAEPASLDEELLEACAGAVCCPELADLPKPSVTGRERLRVIARRVRRHPRLRDVAGTGLAAAVEACVRRGRLLGSVGTGRADVLSLVEDLVEVSSSPQHLARACALLAGLPAPTVVDEPPMGVKVVFDELPPRRLLEGKQEHRRAEALTHLAANACTPADAVTEALRALLPVELSWILHREETTGPLRQAAADLLPDEGETGGVLRLLSDDELDACPDPGAVLQSWLDAPAAADALTRDRIERTVLISRHHTMEHLRQLPADTVLTHAPTDVALPILTRFCGSDPDRWATLLTALTFGHLDVPAFGEILDALEAKSPA
ncbi:hypothetical protein [Streptomyces nanshensis]|uniref:Uncharacterized protein n=1 Tax=Streptomyces nanshensis TaxID=518642 RepID=A0A1E7L556_9ACTN|nr:hypothetical protein [Streptomyces nanshensis]OEV11335.1 hypothetical protein AN218_13365 [Streptomyces nanshensis]